MLEAEVKQGHLSRNVAKLVERAPHRKKEFQTWTKTQARAFLNTVAAHRQHVAWQLTPRGLRRGEVLGLCWSDIDLDKNVLTIRKTRTEAGPVVVEGPPKTARGHRELPLDDALVAVLRAHKA